jgi:hypothetical protein
MLLGGADGSLLGAEAPFAFGNVPKGLGLGGRSLTLDAVCMYQKEPLVRLLLWV